MLKYKKYVTGALQENCYIVWDDESKEAFVIDPGYVNTDEVKAFLVSEELCLKGVIDTHGHWDHIYSNEAILIDMNVPLLIHPEDAEFLTTPDLNLSSKYGLDFISPKADIYIEDGDVISIGKSYLKVLHTPGHTPGSIILYNDDLAFTGDTLFFGSAGRCDFPKSDPGAMKISLNRLKEMLPKEVEVLSGHGQIKTTFAEQLDMNPFLTGQMQPK